MLPKQSVKRPFTVIVAVIIVLILGVVSFTGMSTDLLPNMNLPYVLVLTSYPGASPEEVEMTVTRPVEQSMSTVSTIVNVTSNSRENMSVVILEFSQTANMDSVALDIREKLDMIKGYWNDSVGSPTMIKINPEMLPIMVSAVDVEGKTAAEVSRYTEQTVVPEFESIEGLASVSATGLVEEKIHVILRQDKIDALNKKIRDKVEGDLDDAAEKLADARAQIQSGKYRLNKERSKVMGQLSQAEKQINAAKQKIADGEAQIKESERQIAFLENLLKEAKKGISSQKKELQNQRKALVAQRKQLEAIENPTPEQLAQLQTVKTQIQAIDAAIAGLKYGGEEVAKLQKDLSAQRTALNAAKQQVAAGKKELAQKEAQFRQGKNKAISGFNSASGKLNSAANEVNTAQQELDDNRETALDKADLNEFLTLDMVMGLLMAENFSMPAGYVSEEGTEYLVRVGDKFTTLDDLSKLTLIDLDMEEILDPIQLSDVADVMMVDNSAETYGKVNGNDAALLTFQKQPDYSTEQVTGLIRERAEGMMATESGLRITTLMDQGVYINIVIQSVLENLLYGALLAILILLIFLRDIRPTLVIAFSIPISLVFAIALMYFTGVTINVISLSGLALGVGMLVDNSIVVIENIYRMRNNGVPPAKAAVEGTKQVSGAIFSSTLTTVCVFAPIIFVQGISRQLFTDLALTIAYSLTASLIVALTLVPVMASGALRNVNEKKHRIFDAFKRLYGFTLKGALKVKIPLLLLIMAVFGLSLYYMFSMGTGFIPTMDSNQVSVTLTMEKDTLLEETTAMSDKVMAKIQTLDGVEAVGAMQSGGNMIITGMSSGNSATNTMEFFVVLKEDKVKTSQEIASDIEALSGEFDCELAASGSMMDISALGGSGISVLVKGPEIDELTELASRVAGVVSETEGTENVLDGLDDPAPEIRILVDKDKAIAEGLTVAQVYSEIRNLLSDPQSATTLTLNTTEYPVVVIDGEQEKLTPEDVRNTRITVTDREGEEKTVKVSNIATISEDTGLSVIQREGQQRCLTVTAEISEGYNIGLVSRVLEEKLTTFDVPAGYSLEVKGENETINDTMRDLVLMFGLAVILIYLIMVAQFQSLLSPFIVMFTIPLAMTGGLFALLFTGKDLSIIAMVGFIMLAGIVVNNGIVLIDRIIQLRREEGLDKKSAIIEAGKDRLRPILMTAITTILGLSTMAFGMGMGADMVQPLAIVTIGGLLYATLLTLYVVPCFYDLFNRNTVLKDILQKEEEALNAPSLPGGGMPALMPFPPLPTLSDAASIGEAIPAESAEPVQGGDSGGQSEFDR